jgi:hypothetical protein
MNSTQQWTERDGWILMSLLLVHSEEGPSLTAIIGAADATNHAIPTTGELSRALTRLVNTGVVSVIDQRYRINSIWLGELVAVKLTKGGLFSLPEKGKRWLSSKSFDITTRESVTITSEQLTNAYDEYARSLRKPKTTNKPMHPSGGSSGS